MQGKTFQTLVTQTASELSGYFITLVASASVVVFLWGIAKYIFKGASDSERKKGKDLMVWGIIGLVVMFGVWGIVSIVAETFGVASVVPQFKSNSNSVQTIPLR